MWFPSARASSIRSAHSRWSGALRFGKGFLRAELLRMLAMPPDVLSPRMVPIIEGLASDRRLLDERVENVSNEIEELAQPDAGCKRLMSIPGIGPIISSAVIAAIGTGDAFSKVRDFAAWAVGHFPPSSMAGDRRRMESNMKVTFIGLGNMGGGIANCILRHGFDLTVFNRTREKMEPFIANGAKGGADLKDAVKDADVVFTVLMDDKSVLDNVRPFAPHMKLGAIHVGITTNSPECADEAAKIHAQHGSIYVAGPVVGGPNAAAAGELLSLLAGPTAAIEKASPVVMAYSKKVVQGSEKHGAANTMKLCVNYTIVSIIETFCEVYAFADKAGANVEALKDFLVEAMGHPALKMYAAKIASRDLRGVVASS